MADSRWNHAAWPALVLALFATTNMWKLASSRPGLDYYQFWAVAQAVREGVSENIYSQEEGVRLGSVFQERASHPGAGGRQREIAGVRHELEPLGTPFLYATFAVLVSGDYERDYAAFRMLSIGAALAGIGLLCRMLRFSLTGALVAVGLFLGPFTPMSTDAVVGNVNAIQLGAVVFHLWLACRLPSPYGDLAGGIVLGLAVMFKPNLALAALVGILVLVADGRMTRLVPRVAGMAAAGIAAFVVSAWFFGSALSWWRWLEAVGRVVPLMEIEWGNLSIARLAEDLTGVHVSPFLLAGIVATVAAVLWRGRRHRDATRQGDSGRDALEQDCLAVSTGLGAGLLWPDLTWIHYYVHVIPLALCLWRPRVASARTAGFRWAAAGGVALTCGLPWPAVGGMSTMVQGTLQFTLAAVILVTAGLWELGGPTRRRSSAASHEAFVPEGRIPDDGRRDG